MFGQRSRLKADGLLKKEREHGPKPMQVIRIDPDVDGHRLRTELPKVKVVLGGRPIEDRVQPQVQAARESLADRACGDGREIDHIAESAHALGRQRELAGPPALDQTLPMLREPFIA